MASVSPTKQTGRLVIPDAFREADDAPLLRKSKSWAPHSPTFPNSRTTGASLPTRNGPARARQSTAQPTANAPAPLLQVTEPCGNVANTPADSSEAGEMKRAVSAMFGVELRRTKVKAAAPTDTTPLSPQTHDNADKAPARETTSMLTRTPPSAVSSFNQPDVMCGIPTVKSTDIGRQRRPHQGSVFSDRSDVLPAERMTSKSAESIGSDTETPRGGESPATPPRVRDMWEMKVNESGSLAMPDPLTVPLTRSFTNESEGRPESAPGAGGSPVTTSLSLSKRRTSISFRSGGMGNSTSPTTTPPGRARRDSNGVVRWERRVAAEAPQEEQPTAAPKRWASRTGAPPSLERVDTDPGRESTHVLEKKKVFEAGDEEDLSPQSVGSRGRRTASPTPSASPQHASPGTAQSKLPKSPTKAPPTKSSPAHVEKQLSDKALSRLFEDVRSPLLARGRTLFVVDCLRDKTEVWEYEQGGAKKRPKRRMMQLPSICVALNTEAENDVVDPLLDLHQTTKHNDALSPVIMFSAGHGLKSDLQSGRCDRMNFARFRRKITDMMSRSSFVVMEPEEELECVWRGVNEFAPDASSVLYLGESIFGVQSAAGAHVAQFCRDSAIDSTESLKFHMGSKCRWPPLAGVVALTGEPTQVLTKHCGLKAGTAYPKQTVVDAFRKYVDNASPEDRHCLAVQFLDIGLDKLAADGCTLYLDTLVTATVGATLERLRLSQRKSAFE